MGISPYVRELRELVGNRLLVLPSVAVLPRDGDGRILLVRTADSGHWATIGGFVEPDERPEDAARREAEEEAGVVVRLTGIIDVVGGPGYRLEYPNGDRSAYVSVVYGAVVESGTPRPDHDETIEVGWFGLDELATLELNGLNRRLLEEVAPRLR